MRGNRAVIIIALLVNIAYCANYADSNLPSTISLNGRQRQDTITSTPSPQGWQMTTIGLNRNPHLTINGATNSQYTLTVKDSTTTFYSGGFSVASGIQAALISVHTLAIQSGSVSVGNGGKFVVISSGNTINAQGSSYGGESKVRFERGAMLNLAQNASADFSNASFFIHDGITALSQNSNLKISATKAVRFQNEFVSNGGVATINGNVYNVGGGVGIQNTTSNFTLNGGSVSVVGDFYNGLQSKDMRVDDTGSVAGGFNVYDSAFGGGGNLTIKGGNMNITGALVSQLGGSSTKEGGIANPKNSSISIYGGTLSATGGVQNKVGSTLTIGAYNGKMGQIQGSVDNQGDFIIDALSANAGNYTLITGNFSGNAPSLRNGNSDFTSATLTNGNKTLSVVKNDAKIDDFKMSLNANESATLGAFGDGIYAISGASGAKLKATANAINSAIFSAFYTTPLAMMDALGADLSTTNATKTPSKRTTKLTTRRVATNQSRQNRMRQTRQTRRISTNSAYPNDVSAGFVLKGIAGNSAKGVLGGVKAGYGVDFANAHFALNLAYAYGSIDSTTKCDIATHKTRIQSHNFALRSNIEARFAGNFGFDLGVSGATSLNDSTRAVESSAMSLDSTLKSRQNFYQIAMDLALLYHFKVGNFTIAPYLGLNQGYIAMPNFAEKGAFSSGDAFALSTEAYSAYFLDAFAGAKMGFDFGDYGAILGDLEYKILAYKTQRARILRYANGEMLRFVIPNAHKISADLGYRKDFSQWYLRVDGNFGGLINAGKASDTNTNFYTYGISAKFGYRF